MLIHCTMDELIAIREGRGSAAAREHVDGCDECQAELELLHQRVAALKALPGTRPPRDRWQVVRGRIVAERRRTTLRKLFTTSAAVAASLTLLLTARYAFFEPDTAQADSEVVRLVEEAEQLEVVLRELETSSRVMNARVAVAVSELEDRLGAVNSRLAAIGGGRDESRREMVDLWRARVELMDALVQVRATRATQVGF